jgi:LuxR family maltose regulon positive regulatory protein
VEGRGRRYFGVSARRLATAHLELIRVHLALAGLAGAWTLMREADEVLRRRPGLGGVAGEAQALGAWLSGGRGSSAPGASSLTGAGLRLHPLGRCRYAPGDGS